MNKNNNMNNKLSEDISSADLIPEDSLENLSGSFVKGFDSTQIKKNLAQQIGGTSGAGQEAERKCGPDVSEWFRNEIERNRQNLNSVRANLVPAAWLLWIQRHGLSIRYKDIAFEGENCPSDCPRTVWLCGHCIDRSELGNIMLGFWFGFLAGGLARVLAAGVNKVNHDHPGEGADTTADAAAIGVGFAMANRLKHTRGLNETPQELVSKEDFCNFINLPMPWTNEEIEKSFEIFNNKELWIEGWKNPWREMSGNSSSCTHCDSEWRGEVHPLPPVTEEKKIEGKKEEKKDESKGGRKMFKIIKKVMKIYMIIVIAVVVIGFIYYASDHGGSGGFRSCILNAVADPGDWADCSDGRGGDGKLKDTLINGRHYDCNRVRGDGECVKY